MILYPVWISLVVSFDKSVKFSVPNPPPLIPKDFSALFYKIVLINVPFLKYYFNTIIITAVVFFTKLVLCFMAAYAFSKGKFTGKNIWFMLILITMMMPFQAVLLPSFILINDFGMINTWAAIIVMSIISPLTVFLLKQFLDDIPDSLRESALMDGANELIICYKIYFPLCGPVIATVAILTMVGEWNNYLWPSLVLKTSALYNISVALASFSFEKAIIVGPRSAAAMLGSVPLIIIFLFLQKYIVQGIATSGIKQ